MKRFARPRTGAAAVVSVLSLALVTGCSDSGSGSGSDGKDSGKGSGKDSAAAAKPLGDSELGELIVTTADDAALIDALLGNAELVAMRACFELLVLPRSCKRGGTHESSGSIEIPPSADYLVAAAAPGYGMGASGLE